MPAPLPPRNDPGKPQPGGPGRAPEQEPPRRTFRLPLWYLVGAALLVLLIQWAASGMRYEQITYGRFRALLQADQVKSAELTGNKVRGRLVRPDAQGRAPGFIANRPAGDEELTQLLQEKLGL